MARVLVVYGTTEGQTAKIAERIGEALRALGHEALVAPADAQIDAAQVAACDGVIVGGSLHIGRYQSSTRKFIERHKALLRSRFSAFFSVSLAAASRDPNERAAPLRIAREFVASLNWAPQRIASFAGALKYTRYGWLARLAMKRIARKEGGDTDTSRDYEYTDWGEIVRFAEDLASDLREMRTTRR